MMLCIYFWANEFCICKQTSAENCIQNIIAVVSITDQNFYLLPWFNSPFNPREYIDFGGVITFAVEVWSWKLCQIKDPLVFGAANRGSVNQYIMLRRVVWSSHSSARCFDDSTQYNVLIHWTAEHSTKGQWIFDLS